MKKLFVETIEFYQRFLSFDTGILQVLTPGGACKYPLSCSEYTKQAIKEYGVIKGVKMGLNRIWSCR